MQNQQIAGLSHVIVCDGGEWGKGKDVKEAIANRPYPRRKVSKSAFAYKVSENTVIDEDGCLVRPRQEPAPVLIDMKTLKPI